MERVPRRGPGEALSTADPPAEPVVTARHRLEYWIARSFAAVVAALPWSAAYFLARRAGDLLHLVDGRHREIARENIRARYRLEDGSALSETEVRTMVRDVFRHFVSLGVEVVRLQPEMARRPIEEFLTFEGEESLREAAESGRGAIIVSCHLGNWEIIAAAGLGIGRTPTSVYRPLDNPLLDTWVRSLRGGTGAEVVPKSGAVRGLLRALRKGGIVAILVDQDARRHGIQVPFFGLPASTIPTPAELALRTGAAIIPGFAIRTGPGFRYHTWLEPEVTVRKDADHDQEVERITAELNVRLEAAIRRAPEQWLWLHRRWKSSPPEGDLET